MFIFGSDLDRQAFASGHRFEATQALRQALRWAVDHGYARANVALKVRNPAPRARTVEPFETWEDVQRVADEIGEHYAPAVLFAAATGMRPAEWIGLEWKNIDRMARVAYGIAVCECGHLSGDHCIDSACEAAGCECARFKRVGSPIPYSLRHTFATEALRAGLSTFDVARYMGTSVKMIDEHYGHFARDSRDHAIALLNASAAPSGTQLRAVV